MIANTQLDLLVDGELSDEERREVLSRLDTEPDGWRRCALAFLEAQTWREGMRAVARDSVVELAAASPKRQPACRRLPGVLAMAGCFLVALGLGAAVDELAGHRSSRSTAPVPGVAQVAGGSAAKEATRQEPSPAASPSATRAPETAIPYQYVSIPAEDPVSGKAESIRMPVVPQEYLGEGWPYRIPSVLPDRVVKTLEQQGHEVVQQRRLIPFQAADGSRVIFPVDEVELVPVRNRGYQ